MLKLIVEKGYGDSMQTRNVPTKNYVIFTAMAIFVIAAVLYSANWYSITKDYFIDYSSMGSVVMKIDEESFSNYIKEAGSIVVYISDSKDSSIKSFEKKFKNLVINKGIKSNIIYLDSSKVSDTFLNNFAKTFFADNLDAKKNGTKVIPNLIYFEDGEAIDILYSSETKISIDDVKSFLIECEVIELD